MLFEVSLDAAFAAELMVNFIETDKSHVHLVADLKEGVNFEFL